MRLHFGGKFSAVIITAVNSRFRGPGPKARPVQENGDDGVKLINTSQLTAVRCTFQLNDVNFSTNSY